MSNRLAGTASPYLRQHANNPVDWYPWGKEAFEKAKKENKPIFLSVGYSTCHWCHVMERESFENEGIAAILNKYFVAIKVDRERRPDVDETYMIATQIITKAGGWPNSVFLTPDLKPFFAGTYFPRDVFGRLLNEVGTQWLENEKALRLDGDKISNVIKDILNRRVAARSITPDVLAKAGRVILRDADSFNGGFDTAPKFPNEPTLMFLLQLAAGHQDKAALEAVTRTLDYMLDGGIHDHVGGGFHRYATDNLWRVPHFEKMLYNQAQMVRVLLQAYRLTGRKRYARAAERTIFYVAQHMTSKEGGFFSAWDADSEGGEGLFYVWTQGQLKKVLGDADAKLAANIFGVTDEGNFEGRTILHFPEHPEQLADRLKLTNEQFDKAVLRIRSKLYEARNKRVPPHLDEKVILSWNGMMIAAIAEAALVLKNPQYIKMTEKALLFIDKNMKGKEGGYMRSYFEGKAELVAQQEDYAYLALAYIHLYDAGEKAEYLKKAQDLVAIMIRKFVDPDTGDFFMVAKSDTFARGKTRSDGATPSGNSTALEVLAMLSHRHRDPTYRNSADKLLAALSGLAVQSPRSAAYVLRGADMMRGRETGEVQYFAQGVVRAQARIDKKNNRASLLLKIAPGWHINSSEPLEEDFVPTKVSTKNIGAGGGETVYPQPVMRRLKFNDGEMALYEKTVKMKVPLDVNHSERVNLKITLQACSDEICLEPVEGVVLARE
ncbi:MAG: DUF255 domain-containing protein [Hyphomicrobiaceae bacterium]|nr:DUF255 domain-containing protein [Hyphomicrobiaceae bacterium]